MIDFSQQSEDLLKGILIYGNFLIVIYIKIKKIFQRMIPSTTNSTSDPNSPIPPFFGLKFVLPHIYSGGVQEFPCFCGGKEECW